MRLRPPSEHRPSRSGNIYRSGVSAQVKWFDPNKGFGFVTPDDGSGDAFLHASVVRAAGYEALTPGSTLVCDLGPGQKGPQVVVIHSVTEAPVPAAPARGRGRPGQPARARQPGRTGPAPRAGRASAPVAAPPPARIREIEGTVKFYNADKGFGFIVPDRGDKDIFVHESALRRSGLEALQPRVRVRVFARETERGAEADRVEFL